MNYHDIRYDDLLNGDGIRCVLFVSGCEHKCKGCHNKQAWDIDSGYEFNDKCVDDIVEYCENKYVSGLTLSGGDALHSNNYNDVLELCKVFRLKHSNKKTIWLYTGYKFDDIKNLEILKFVDVIVDGKYIEEFRDVNCHWRGSTNQNIYRKVNNQWIKDEVIICDQSAN